MIVHAPEHTLLVIKWILETGCDLVAADTSGGNRACLKKWLVDFRGRDDESGRVLTGSSASAAKTL